MFFIFIIYTIKSYIMKTCTTEFDAGLKKGAQYQDYLIVYFYKFLNRTIIQFSSQLYQYTYGETLTGEEIKYDSLMKHTGNLYIEVAEKTNAQNKTFIKSGIYAKDRIHTFIIGDYNECFLFDISKLKELHDSEKFRVAQIDTSIGFLLPKEEALKHCKEHIIFNKKGAN